MKIASILAGVAIAAMTASAASADIISQGQWTNNGPVFGVVVPGFTRDVPSFLGGLSSTNIARAANANSQVSAWHAVGVSVGDVGAVGNEAASFSLEGSVSKDCVYYSGDNSAETFDFGTLGIYAGDNTGPNAAFTMVAPAVLTIQTNLAGCNTNNTVKLSRTANDMVNASTAGYDQAVFTNKLPYSVTASYKGSSQSGGAGAAINRDQLLAEGAPESVQANGAWKSPMTLAVVVSQPTQALLAGDYAGTFSLTITAQ
ncbi:hypothetical protein [Brevundimonas bullata]|uniref:hypothetical protein n=1 Tax=Brevundimonas bullata TaxID=13160 RepID=UPI002FD9404C